MNRSFGGSFFSSHDTICQALEEQRQMLEDQLELLAQVPSCATSAKDRAGQCEVPYLLGDEVPNL